MNEKLLIEKYWPVVRFAGLRSCPVAARSGFPWPSGDRLMPFANQTGYVGGQGVEPDAA